MKNTKSRLIALFLAVIICLSAFLTACSDEKKSDDATETEEETDVTTLLQDAYKKTRKLGSLAFDIESEYVNDGDYRYESLGGFFGKHDSAFAGYVDEYSNDTHWFYLDDTLYGYDGEDAWKTDEVDEYDLTSACFENWIFSTLGIYDFDDLAEALGEEEDVTVTTKTSSTTVTYEGKLLNLMKLLNGEAYDKDDYDSSTRKANAEFEIKINKNGYISSLTLEAEYKSDSIFTEVLLSDFSKKAAFIEKPEWFSHFSDKVPQIPAGEEPYLLFHADNITLFEDETDSIPHHIEYGSYYESIYYTSLNPTIAYADENGDVYAQKEGTAEILLTVENEQGDVREYIFTVYVISRQNAPVIKVHQYIIDMYKGDELNIWDYFDVENADSVTVQSDSDVVFLDDQTFMEAIKAGIANITITAKNTFGSVSEKVIITVRSAQIPEVMFFEESARITIGKTYPLGEMSFTTADEVYYVSQNTNVATVNSKSGLITAVSEGNTNILVYATVNGKDYLAGTFPVYAEAPWCPTDPTTLEVLTAIETLPKYNSMAWFNVNITSLEQYNIRGLETAQAGPVEIWSNHLEMLIMLDQSEASFVHGADDMETYAYRFDFYYRPYDPNNARGNYKKATLKPWSIYTAQNAIYRLPFYDAFNMDKEHLIEGQEYEVIIVFREGETLLGYAESAFTWTDSCASFVEYAEYDNTIIK